MRRRWISLIFVEIARYNAAAETVPWILAAVFLMLVPVVYGAAMPDRSKEYVQGVVTGAEKDKVQFPNFTTGGNSPADAPLTTRYYAYDVSICVNGQTHVGRYETLFNYLPSPFNRGQSIGVRLTRRVMYFDLPNDPDMRMGIIRQSAGCDLN